MAKGDVYYLISPEGHIDYKFEFTGDYMTGDCYEAVSWYVNGDPFVYHFFASVYCNPDSCTHWWFRGEDYDEGMDGTENSYYHICGDFCFINHIRAMCFIWKLAHLTISESMKSSERGTKFVDDGYFGDPYLKDLVESMLKDYRIEKEEKKEC